MNKFIHHRENNVIVNCLCSDVSEVDLTFFDVSNLKFCNMCNKNFNRVQC